MTQCLYLPENEAITEHYVFSRVDSEELDTLLGHGYRHFAKYFFRPLCEKCQRCIPIRVLLDQYAFSPSAMRLFKMNHHLKVELADPVPSQECYRVYLEHKIKFSGASPENYSDFVESFFYPFDFSQVLKIYDGNRLVAFCLLDFTNHAISAVYCAYLLDKPQWSLGRFSILNAIKLGKERRADYLYLGYYIRDNRHMRYKIQYHPAQLLVDRGRWVNVDHKQERVKPAAYSFFPQERIISSLPDSFRK